MSKKIIHQSVNSFINRLFPFASETVLKLYIKSKNSSPTPSLKKRRG